FSRMASSCPFFTFAPRWTKKCLTGAVIFGETVACSRGWTTASADTTWEIELRVAGVISTETTGSFSFSGSLQPAARHTLTIKAPREHHTALHSSPVLVIVLMGLSSLLSEFANLPARHGISPLRLGKHCLPARWSSESRQPQGRSLRRSYSAGW